MHYLALAFANGKGGYGFTIPDIRGLAIDAGAVALDESLAVARRVLADHLAALADAGLDIPAARPPEQVLEDPEVREDVRDAVTTVMLPAILPAGRTVRVNITMDESTLALVDGAACDRNLTRSAFIAEAARRFATGDTHAPA